LRILFFPPKKTPIPGLEASVPVNSMPPSAQVGNLMLGNILRLAFYHNFMIAGFRGELEIKNHIQNQSVQTG